MLRRTITLALAGLALAAPPALAGCHWNSQMTDASNTASRSAAGCTVKPGWRHSLSVTCDSRHTATFVYIFPVGHGSSGGQGKSAIQGTPTSGVSSWGRADVDRSVKVAGDKLRVTVTVTDGMAQLYTVSVGYYTVH
jgi:hypothetical protein